MYFIIAKSKIPFIIYKPLFAKHCTYVTGSLQRRHRDALSHILRFIWYQHPLPYCTPGNRPYFCSLSLTCHMISSISYDMGFRGGSEGKASACDEGDPGLIPGSGRSPGEGNGNPLQYACLENPTDRGVWWATVHGVAKSQTRTSAQVVTSTRKPPSPCLPAE